MLNSPAWLSLCFREELEQEETLKRVGESQPSFIHPHVLYTHPTKLSVHTELTRV